MCVDFKYVFAVWYHAISQGLENCSPPLYFLCLCHNIFKRKCVTSRDLCHSPSPSRSLLTFPVLWSVSSFVLYLYIVEGVLLFLATEKNKNTFPLKCCPWLNHGLAIHVCQCPATPTVSLKTNRNLK